MTFFAPSLSARKDRGVEIIHFMTVLASLKRQALPAPDSRAAEAIFRTRNRLQVVGIYATSHTAQVIEFQPVRDAADVDLVAKDVGERGRQPRAGIELPIAR